LKYRPRNLPTEQCIDGADVSHVLKRQANEAGIENDHRLSGHALRRCFVTGAVVG